MNKHRKSGNKPEKPSWSNQIWEEKQRHTTNIFKESISKDYELMSYFQQLIDAGYKIAVASNSIRNTVKIVLLRLGILEFIDIFISNEEN